MKPPSPATRVGPTPAPSVQVVGGPDCSPPIDLVAGRHIIGRSASACVRIDDRDLELHHALLDVDDAGGASVHQLSGRRPMYVVDSCGVRTQPDPNGSVPLTDGGSLVLGATEIRVTHRAARARVDDTVGGMSPLADALRRLRLEGWPLGMTQQRGEPSVSLGVGDVPSLPSAVDDPAGHLTAAPLRRAAFTWTARAGSVTRLSGPRHACLALARSMIVQLAMASSPPVWALTVETPDRNLDWRWLTALAHRATHTRLPDTQHSDDVSSIRIVDGHTSPVGRDSAAVIAVVGSTERPMANTIQIGSAGRARWSTDPVDRWFTMTGIGSRRAADIARHLSDSGTADMWRCDHAVGGSPSSQRGPDPKVAAASSVL